jgi:GT2 family glycosyltransferase
MPDALYIILPVHNRRALTMRFAEALARQTDRDFQLLLVDDGSSDGTADAVRAILPQTTVIRGSGDWWWAGALQQAWLWLQRAAPAVETVVGICNDDMGISDEFLAQARAELAAHPRTLLLAREVDASTGIPAVTGVRADLAHLRFAPCADPAAINCLPTRGLFLRWGDFREIGGFRPKQLPHYLSDYEFTLRAHRRGFSLRVAETVTVRTGGRSTGWAREDLWRAPRGRRRSMIFSRRFKENPEAWSGFARLAAPAGRRPWLQLKIWLNTARLVALGWLLPVRHE